MTTDEQQHVETTETDIDSYPVSFCVICTYDDWRTNALTMMRSLPSSAQVCVLINEEGTSEQLTDIDIATHADHTLRSRKWTYPPGQFSFAKARNLCQQMATNDWIFWIDCDEMLAAAQHAGIVDSIGRVGGGVGGFYAGQASLSMFESMTGAAPKGIYVNIEQCRLYRNNCGFTWEGYAHEQIVGSISSRGYSIIQTTLTVIHNGYSGDHRSLVSKLRRNTTLIGRWLRDHDESHEYWSFYSDLWSRDYQALITTEKTLCQSRDM